MPIYIFPQINTDGEYCYLSLTVQKNTNTDEEICYVFNVDLTHNFDEIKTSIENFIDELKSQDKAMCTLNDSNNSSFGMEYNKGLIFYTSSNNGFIWGDTSLKIPYAKENLLELLNTVHTLITNEKYNLTE